MVRLASLKSKLPALIWDSSHQLKALRTNTEVSWTKRSFAWKVQHGNPARVPSPLACPAGCRRASSHDHISQFFKLALSSYIDTYPIGPVLLENPDEYTILLFYLNWWLSTRMYYFHKSRDWISGHAGIRGGPGAAWRRHTPVSADLSVWRVTSWLPAGHVLTGLWFLQLHWLSNSVSCQNVKCRLVIIWDLSYIIRKSLSRCREICDIVYTST